MTETDKMISLALGQFLGLADLARAPGFDAKTQENLSAKQAYINRRLVEIADQYERASKAYLGEFKCTS